MANNDIFSGDEALSRSYDNTNRAIKVVAVGGMITNDDVLLKLGTDADIAQVLISAGIAANTAITSVLIGTPVAKALAANSFILSDITANGDIAFYGNLGGNSQQFLFYDTSATQLRVNSLQLPNNVWLKIENQDGTAKNIIQTGADNITRFIGSAGINYGLTATGTINYYTRNTADNGDVLYESVAAGNTAVITWSNATHAGIVLSGFLNANGQYINNIDYLEDNSATPAASGFIRVGHNVYLITGMNNAAGSTRDIFSWGKHATDTIEIGGDGDAVRIQGPLTLGSTLASFSMASGATITGIKLTGASAAFGGTVLATGAGKTVDEVITALQGLGLVTQS